MKSDSVKKGISQAPHRSLFNALGYTEEERRRPMIGIVSSYNEIVPGHMNLDKITEAVKLGVAMAGGMPVVFPAIAVCDGIAMGHIGMKYSLVTRDLIADSTECMAKAHGFDGLVMIPNCDKNVPGLLMAAARVNVPTIFVSGGPMLAGHIDGRKRSLSSMFEAVGSVAAGKMTMEKLAEYEEKVCPTCGSCSGMYTANSMNCLTEAIGMGLQGNGTIPAVYSARIRLAKHAGMKIMELVEKNIRPRDIMTEKAFMNAQGGAVAFYGTTRTVYAPQNKKINSAFMKFVLSYDENGKPITLGEAQRQAKNYLVKNNIETTKNKLQYSLLGDPALSLALPTYTAIIDNINGVAVEGDNLPQLRAGDKVNIKGHIEYAGNKADSFSGTLDAMVRDTKETIKCKLNNTTSEGADTAFVFTDRKNILYHGTNKVENGEFNFTFAVPKDINYADGTGLINIYAYDATLNASAHGACERFTVNGSNIAENDSIGPSVYCYLNSEDFTFGGEVNSTPFFVAQINDKDGINASGAGIGHDMTLIIDGDIEKTYNLNDNFTFDYESYTSGQTYFALPALSEGKHTLKFRAWDILNNSSTTTLDFVVRNSIQPNITDVYATNNPARESTTFVVAHNFCGADLDLVIEIMDSSGRLLWSTSENGTATTNTIAYKWDLRTDSGAKLNTGIYLYRVRLNSNGSSYATKTQKLIVIQ